MKLKLEQKEEYQMRAKMNMIIHLLNKMMFIKCQMLMKEFKQEGGIKKEMVMDPNNVCRDFLQVTMIVFNQMLNISMKRILTIMEREQDKQEVEANLQNQMEGQKIEETLMIALEEV